MDVSKEFVPYLNVTTLLDDSPDQGLLDKLGGGGFPSMVFIEPETGALLTEHYWRPSSAEDARAQLKKATDAANELRSWMAKAKAAPDDAAVQAALALKLGMMRVGERSMEELEKLAKTEGLDPDVKDEFDAWYPGAAVQKVYDDAGSTAQSQQEFMDLATKGYYELLKRGIRLPVDHDSAQMYYDLGLTGAVHAGDAEIAKVAFDQLSAVLNSYKSAYEGNDDMLKRIDDAIADAKSRLDGIPAKKDE